MMLTSREWEGKLRRRVTRVVFGSRRKRRLQKFRERRKEGSANDGSGRWIPPETCRRIMTPFKKQNVGF